MIIIHNALITNEGQQYIGYIAILDDRIAAVRAGVPTPQMLTNARSVIDARGAIVMPGVIDDQVHFREPGMTYKGEIRSESRAALAGGVTSYMEMPNTKPPTTTIELLEQKYERAAEVSAVNFAFFLGATNDNLDEIRRLDPHLYPGLKIFMGSSTGNLLVDSPKELEAIFRESPVLIATHCEEDSVIREAAAKIGSAATINDHPVIRSAEACYASTSKAVELATRTGARLHVLHLSTARELELFKAGPLAQKRITNEVCVHHLWFSDQDYGMKGNLIKWNPAIKTEADRQALREGVLDGRVDIVATDHAPHTLAEKQLPYLEAPSGGPLVQHSLVAMLQMFAPEKVVEMMCHRPAQLFGVEGRGYLREGYFADIVIVDPTSAWEVNSENTLYKCGWSPFEGYRFRAQVTHTFVNGNLGYCRGKIDETLRGRRLTFQKCNNI